MIKTVRPLLKEEDNNSNYKNSISAKNKQKLKSTKNINENDINEKRIAVIIIKF
jgi:hypothetical protein